MDTVTERSFRVTKPERCIPGVLWAPATVRVLPKLVLMGHGGSGDKRSARMVELGRWFAARGLAAVAIDGPYHGERAGEPAADGADAVLDAMADDWRSTVDSLSSVADTGNLGFIGMSMGTRLGIPAVAAMHDRFRCVVMGKFGLEQSELLPPNLYAPERIAREAARVTAPALLRILWRSFIWHHLGGSDDRAAQ